MHRGPLKRRAARRRIGLMESLYRPLNYPMNVQDELKKLAPLATEIANRWMRGWPRETKAHLKSGDFLELLKYHEDQERRAGEAGVQRSGESIPGEARERGFLRPEFEAAGAGGTLGHNLTEAELGKSDITS